MKPRTVNFAGIDDDADLSVIIVNYNTAHMLPRCIDRLRAACLDLRVQLFIVDNASRDDSVRLIRERFPDAVLLANETNVGFGRANNQALPLARGRHVLLLNADAFVMPDTLKLALKHLDEEPRCGVLGVHSVDEAGRSLFAGRSFPTAWSSFTLQTGLFRGDRSALVAATAAPAGDAVDCDWVVGCCYFVRGELARSLGLFDPRFFLYFEEVDHCRRVLRAGWRVQCLTNARVVHEGGGAAASEGGLSAARQISAFQVESSLLYYRKHGGLPGVMAATALALTTEAVLALKHLLRQGSRQGLTAHARSVRQWLALLLRTRVGRVPTR